MSKTAKSKATVCSRAVLETAAKSLKFLVSVGLQMRCFGATEELVTLTKQMKIGRCDVRVN